MSEAGRRRERHGEAFWRTHHEAWKRSDLNQRQYCAAQGIALKAFGNWRARFKAEPKLAERRLLYRRGGLSHTLSHTLSHSLSHTLSHVTYPSSAAEPDGWDLVVVPPREGHRRRFSTAERWRIVAEAEQPGTSLSAIARRYGIARRVLCRWKQELMLAREARFVAVEINDAPVSEAVP
jgi:Transposase